MTYRAACAENSHCSLRMLPYSVFHKKGKPLRHRTYRDRRITPQELWSLAAPSAHGLRGTPFGTKEMDEMCENMGGILSAASQLNLDEVEAAAVRNDAYVVLAMANRPFEPLYRTRRSLPGYCRCPRASSL